MSNLRKLMEVLDILNKYDITDGNACAEHDILYLPGPQEVSPEDKDRLLKLGAHWDRGLGCWAFFT